MTKAGKREVEVQLKIHATYRSYSLLINKIKRKLVHTTLERWQKHANPSRSELGNKQYMETENKWSDHPKIHACFEIELLSMFPQVYFRCLSDATCPLCVVLPKEKF